jgi:DNA modification methylase
MESERNLELSIEYRPVTGLAPYARNARTHSKHQVRQIADSIRAFGFTNPILIDNKNTIVAGHGRVRAAALLGMQQVPTIRLDSLSEEQIRAYVLADNKLAENAGWDKSILAIEFQHLLTIESGNLNITVTGFEIPEIDIILQETSAKPDEDDELLGDTDGPAVTKQGDLWKLGKHRLLCANSLHEESYKILMADRRAAVVFSDPPYNVKIDGHVCGNGETRHREFAMASGEMSEAEFVAFLSTSLRLLAQHSALGSVHFICMDWRHMKELLAAGGQAYDSLVNLCVWVKDNGGMGSFYRSRHELVFVFRYGKGSHRNNVQLGRFGRYRTNVWEYPGVNTLSKSGEEGNLLALHPTVKPVALVADALLDCSARGEIVLDGFLGSGSTLLAAERVGRVCYGIEIDPLYIDVAIRVGSDIPAASLFMLRQGGYLKKLECAMDEGDDMYHVGYGKPPKRSRFVKGQSGNPKGRPKGKPPGSKGLDTILFRMNGELIKVTQNGRSRDISRLEAIVLQLANKAAAGDPRAAKEYLRLLTHFPDLERTVHPPPNLIVNFVDSDGTVLSAKERAEDSDPDLPET